MVGLVLTGPTQSTCYTDKIEEEEKKNAGLFIFNEKKNCPHCTHCSLSCFDQKVNTVRTDFFFSISPYCHVNATQMVAYRLVYGVTDVVFLTKKK